MKISIIGAGNVGSLTTLRIAQQGLGEVYLIDVAKGLACGKAFDLEDARSLIKSDYKITGSEDINQVLGSDIVVMTAGLARKPGMTREDLVSKNAQIIKEVCLNIKTLAPKAIVIVVTNPLDVMTYLALKTTGFSSSRVFGMGASLDAARFNNLISKELKIAARDVEGMVIGCHGEAMIPLPRFSYIKGKPLPEIIDEKTMEDLVNKTKARGLEIVSLLGNGSAFFAPSAAITELVAEIIKNEKRTIGVSAYLNGEYGVKDVTIGVPCVIGKKGIEDIVELSLSPEEKNKFHESAQSIRQLISQINIL
ncbi:MAG: malate dehydrogenase [Candidatus Omnitrophota bacterium]|nr:malate dehydrogenase [Candidatus Omnitrophota bacterium]MBU1928772.1 malate dehydrogenase [Candidatus Omnitrophota bacterium]MBU2034227.1 malate dehydrogenase [Candidatus Omnitrophota bacterium]MBU2258278.1 malate dehydrogenase [Candidatus Omnitrophota bacterium]